MAGRFAAPQVTSGSILSVLRIKHLRMPMTDADVLTESRSMYAANGKREGLDFSAEIKHFSGSSPSYH
jgi:hypothetical protein